MQKFRENYLSFEFYGESHGEGYGGIIRGLPEGFRVDTDAVNRQLYLRKSGFGRSERQNFADVATFENNVTKGGELKFFVPNAKTERRGEISALRSGHADVTGKARFSEKTVREIAEIASARNSVCYVVTGAVCRQILEKHDIFVFHYVEKIGGISSQTPYVFGISEKSLHFARLHCADKNATELMSEKISAARAVGNSLGGVVAVGARGVPCGVGEILPYAARLDAQIAANLVGIPSVKGIIFGEGEKIADLDGVSAHDRLEFRDGKIAYAENKCGGIVGGISDGQDILCKLFVKPVPTVKGVETVDDVTGKIVPQHFERADTCVVPNVGVIGENILAFVLLNQMTKQNSI